MQLIVKDLLGSSENIVYPTTIIKMLLNYNFINNFIMSYANMINKNTVYNEDALLEPGYKHEKFILFNKILNATEFIQIDGWPLPDGIRGPYLHKREIIFCNDKTSLLLIYTHRPISDLFENGSYVNDTDVREIKSFVYDNIEPLKSPTIVNRIHIDDIKKHRRLTTRYNKNYKDLVRIVKIYDDYRWEFFKKN